MNAGVSTLKVSNLGCDRKFDSVYILVKNNKQDEPVQIHFQFSITGNSLSSFSVTGNVLKLGKCFCITEFRCSLTSFEHAQSSASETYKKEGGVKIYTKNCFNIVGIKMRGALDILVEPFVAFLFLLLML